MSKFLRNPPSATSLLESMRDIGYSLETALADLIDNSISANAQEVEIFCIPVAKTPYVAIIDDGHGMDKQELLIAMQHGGVSTQSLRTKQDLGRFGLGLKTASFSQCRSLTVISKKEGYELVGLCWDLDVVAEKDDWVIRELTTEEIATSPHITMLKDHGTVIVWEKLDRLFEGEEGHKRDELVNAKLEVVRRHLSLVFHRFLNAELKSLGFNKLTISLNAEKIKAFDPFCLRNPATQMLPMEVVRIRDSKIEIQPYILPHHSRLTASEYDYYQNRSDFISNQGAYVYRNGRLMAWGDWFRLVPKGEATKLARVQIDFSNELDELWTIDIKKSRAQPPRPVRERLRQIITQVSSTSARVHRGRGERYFHETKAPFWERFADRDNFGIKFEINKSHPLILSLKEKIGKENNETLDLILDSISSSLPIEMIYSDYSSSPQQVKQYEKPSEIELKNQINELKYVLFSESDFEKERLLDICMSFPKYRENLDLVKKIVDEI